MHAFGLRRWRAFLSRLAALGYGRALPPSARSRLIADRTARAVRVAATYGPWRGNCLHRSITLWWMLRLQGVECDLRFGARMEGGALDAHSWVECEGASLDTAGSADRRYAPFVRAPTRDEPSIP